MTYNALLINAMAALKGAAFLIVASFQQGVTMLYVNRDTFGEIIMLSKEPTADCREMIAPDSAEVLAFLADQPGSASHFIASDLAFVRVVEDILEVLLEKGIITFTDLPEAAQSKVMQRKSLRSKNDLRLLSDDDTIQDPRFGSK